MTLFLVIIIPVLIGFLTSCSLCGVDGDEEGVFIKKPYIFGKGGVDPKALVEGSEWKVFSTDCACQVHRVIRRRVLRRQHSSRPQCPPYLANREGKVSCPSHELWT